MPLSADSAGRSEEAIAESRTRAGARNGDNVTRSWRAFDFGTLPSFSRSHAAAWNALCRAVVGGTGWQTWITEGLGDVIESPGGLEIRLRQKHTIDSERAETVFTSTTGEIILGRDEVCDIRLTPRAVGNRHTRIYTQGGKCFLEDLGSALGTFLNESRLAPNQPTPIATGEQFAIFPYSFTVEVTELWIRGGPFHVFAGSVLPLDSLKPVAANVACFPVHVQPFGAAFLLEADRCFLEKLAADLLAPLCPGLPARLGLTPADTGFLELLIAAVLERMNRDLQFPLQAALAPESSPPQIGNHQKGLAFSFAIRVADMTGTFRLMITDDAIQLLANCPIPKPSVTIAEVSWIFPLSAGSADLTAAEIALIESGDIVLLSRETALLFPNRPERGWRLMATPGNLRQAGVDNYFERGCVDHSESEPDLASLPIRLHAIIGEKEITLAEANRLVAGAIVELDATRSDPVRITLNGKTAGTGELVEVEGRLGVRILAWRVP
jgi:flagellar motor switch/type III secretory pathway protein FliN